MYPISCSRCNGKLLFPDNIDRKDAVTKAHTRHNWKSKGKKLYCDGCSELMKLADEKIEKPKQKEDEDDYIELGE